MRGNYFSLLLFVLSHFTTFFHFYLLSQKSTRDNKAFPWMLLSQRKKSLAKDEENNLCVDTTTPATSYGAIPATTGGPPSSDDTSSSRGNSDADERESNHSTSSIVKRKKRRMEERQCCRRPKVATRLSAMLPIGHSSDDESDDDRPSDLVLPALDPKYIHKINHKSHIVVLTVLSLK
jgi:hypothetical protein